MRLYLSECLNEPITDFTPATPFMEAGLDSLDMLKVQAAMTVLTGLVIFEAAMSLLTGLVLSEAAMILLTGLVLSEAAMMR